MINIRRSLVLVLTIIFLLLGINIYISKQSMTGVVKAFGPLKVTFPFEPLFAESNFFPGKRVEKTFTVENTDNKMQLVFLKANNIITSSNSQLSGVLDIMISQNGKPLYGLGSSTGQKTLTDFISEGQIQISQLAPGEKSDYIISLQMDNNAGNEYQGLSVSFDIIVGINVESVIRIPTLAPIPTIRRIPTIVILPKYR